ncbi:MAG: tyrosine--tRNA ligase, partial [Phycisphaerales bacterium]|nr:tyrosine--tRNA ligase [Phycisphaerales bacterium]
VGFDPTADSLTIGNLVGIVALRRWQDAGHIPVVVMGGGTGLIGDPSGKSAERQLRTREEVNANVEKQKTIFRRVLRFDGAGERTPTVLNNADWLGAISYLDALRDIGKHFSVNMMMAKDSVKERLNNRDQGISYTEFSYMILQAYDFAYLFEREGVTVQMGGSDQFGNIVVGIDLIRKLRAPGFSPGSGVHAPEAKTRAEARGSEHAFGLTWPLVTKADGTKFGKTESGAIWLTAKRGEDDTSPNRTSPFQFYQFWLNTADADVVRFLKIFTLLPHERITELAAAHEKQPGAREAHTALAEHMTALLHGDDELAKVKDATRALFAKPSADGLFTLPEEVLGSAPSSQHERALLEGEGLSIVDLLAATTLVKSKTEARTQLAQNAISVNGRPATIETRVTAAMLLPGGVIALRRGKKTWHVARWA